MSLHRPLVLALAAALPVACVGASAPPSTPADAQWAQSRWPGTTVADLDRGRGVFLSKCSACHSLPSAGAKTPDEWGQVMTEMGDAARLSGSDRDVVLRYLSATSERTRQATGG